MAELVWRSAAVSDCGRKRKENQDNYYISPDNRVFVVADGMGGMAGGAYAAKLAVEAIQKACGKGIPTDGSAADGTGPQEWLREVVKQANRSVHEARCNIPAVGGMGSTLVVALQDDQGTVHIAHVGDSRAYLLRKGELKQLTQDHTVSMELVLNEMLAPEQYANHPFKNYLTRCIGQDEVAKADVTSMKMQPGDWLLLCSDGLTAVMNDADITKELKNDPEQVCSTLLKNTLDGGAPDNVTVIVVKYSAASTKPTGFESKGSAASVKTENTRK